MRPHPVSLTALALLSLAAPAASQQVLVVAKTPGPGVFSTSIAAAVGAAAPGDIVLVKAGSYPESVEIASKSLTVIAEAGSVVTLEPGHLHVSGLSASQVVVVRGIDFAGGSAAAFDLSSNAGVVWIEDCDFQGGLVRLEFSFDVAGGYVTDGASVTFARCHVVGGQGVSVFPDSGGSGLVASGSSLFLLDTTFVGADGEGGGGFNPAVPGGSGATVSGGMLVASGSTFRGGAGGGSGLPIPFPGGASGGAGLYLDGTSASALDCTFVGGAGGMGILGPGPSGAPVAGTTLTILPGAARHFSSSSPIREGQAVDWSFQGAPGEVAAVLYSAAPSLGIPLLAFGGAILVDPASAGGLIAGNVANDGTLAVSFAAPSLPASLQGATIYLQSVHFDVPLTYAVLGPSSTLTLIDGTF